MTRIIIGISIFVVVSIALSVFIFGDDVIISPKLVKNTQNFKLTYDVQHGKSVNGGTLVRGYCIVPFDIQRNKIKPTALLALKLLHTKFPSCKWFIVYLKPTKRLDALQVGRAEMIKNIVTLTYCIPSDKYIKDWNSDVGKPILNNKGLPTGIIDDSPKLHRPTKQEFDHDAKILSIFHDLEKQNIGNPGLHETEFLNKIAKMLHESFKQVRKDYHFISAYYNVASTDREEISL